MTTNVGTIDRVLRAAFGIVLLYLAIVSPVTFIDGALFAYAAVIVGIVMLATSTLTLCPIYSIFGIKTCKAC